MNRLILLLLCLFPFVSHAADTRGLRVVAKDPATNQTAEVKLYNKSYAVVIGIDQYQNLPPDRQLNNAVHDAKGVADVLKRNFRFDKIVSLYNREATKDRILELLTEELPRSMGPEDSVFIFWAGHGNQEESAEGDIGYLIPYDGATDKIRKNITMTEIRDTISKKIPAKHVLYVMDACYSGLLTTRSVDINSRRDLAYIKSITKERVRQVLTAGSKGEEVLDGGPRGHSVFTGRLIEALEAAGDFITANEIQAILKEKVYGDARGRGKAQTPAFGSLYGSGDYVFVPSSEWKLEQQRAEQRLRQQEIDKSLQEQAKLNREMAELAALEQKAKHAANDRERRKLEDQQRIAQAKLAQERLRQQALEAEKQRKSQEEKELQQIEEQRKRQLDEARQMEARFRQEDALRQSELQRLEQGQLKKKRDEEQKLVELRKQAEERRKHALAAASDALSIEAAVAEIKNANARIDEIKKEFSTELGRRTAAARARLDEKLRLLKQGHDQRMQALQGQKVQLPPKPATAPKDEFETDAEYKARLARAEEEYQQRVTEARAGVGKARQAEEEAHASALQQAKEAYRLEVSQLEGTAATEQQAAIKPFQERIATITSKEYPVSPQGLKLAIGSYNPEKGAFPVSISSNSPTVQFSVSGTLMLARENARQFKQQYQNGLIRVQASMKTGRSEPVRIALLNDGVTNDADNYLLEYLHGEFMTVAERKRRETEERERLVYTDPQSGFQWLRDGNVTGKSMTWHEAMEWVKTVRFGGYTDWRLPTKDELAVFVQRGGERPSAYFNANGFRNVQANVYCSSSNHSGYADNAWYVSMHNGYVYNYGRDNYSYVWPVRDAK